MAVTTGRHRHHGRKPPSTRPSTHPAQQQHDRQAAIYRNRVWMTSRLRALFPDMTSEVRNRVAALSMLAGHPEHIDHRRPYRVQYRRLNRGKALAGTVGLALLNIGLEATFMWWMLQPTHWVDYSDAPMYLQVINAMVIVCIGLVELFRFINTISMSLASILARDPIPVMPQSGKKVAFVTTIVPGKEPLSMLVRTLEAACQLVYDGPLDIWVLDEGNDKDVRKACEELTRKYGRAVKHFSRKGIERYNQKTKPNPFRWKTKHGNYNAWLDAVGDEYDFFASVDTDHVPLPNFIMQMMGYFRDPDVAFVTAPQFYGNVDNWVTEAAESQQFPFHSVIQRAGNFWNASMFVGTNNMVRVSALRSIGGLVDSSTEDLATGIKFHCSRNPHSRKRWKSVYTPSLIAIGEGPSTWAEYLQQQDRWSGGTFALLRTPWRLLRLSLGRLWHYSLIMSFYPSMAMGWIFGVSNAWAYALFGAGGLVVPVEFWLALFVDTTATQMYLYNRNRRYNVSPFEAENTPGFKGMIMSVLAAPVFAVSMMMTLIGKSGTFNVTAKGEGVKRDQLGAYTYHLRWATLLVAAISVAVYNGYFVAQALLLPGMSLVICLAPVVHGTLLPVCRELRELRAGYKQLRNRPDLDLGHYPDSRKVCA